MKTAGDLRRLNLASLVRESGGVSSFSAMMGKSSSAQVSQWLNASKDSKTGKPRQISDASARAIEAAANRPHGWLDQDHTAPIIPPGADVVAWENPEDLDPEHYVFVPHYDVQLSAGDGATAQWVRHDDNDPLAFSARYFQAKGLRPDRCRALYVRGVSMEPTLLDGDTVLIDTSRTAPEDDAVFALLVDGDLYIKRLFRLPGGGLDLRSDNPRYPPRELRGADLEGVLVLGRMVWRGG
jgi:phage repressor protein C with HTH and peptisase S24 domain